jgi:hypothetical protein
MTRTQGGNVLKTDDGYDIRIDYFRLSEDKLLFARGLDPYDWVTVALRACESVTALRDAGVTISPCGGSTIAQVYDGDTMVAESAAICSPFDNFNKKIGRAIATGRALKSLSRK